MNISLHHLRRISPGVWVLTLAAVMSAPTRAQWIFTALQPVHPAGVALPVPQETRSPISSLPFEVTEPGSYYLTSTLEGQTGAGGITILADNVTIDLDGHALIGGAGSLTAISAPSSTPRRRNIVIRNGTIDDWGGSGVLLTDAENCRISDLRVSQSGLHGIMNGWASETTGCTALGNGGIGIGSNDGNTISSCVARANDGDGFLVASRSVVSACSASLNGGVGFQVHRDSTLQACHAAANGSRGFTLLNRNTLKDCSATANGGDGVFVAESMNRVQGCHLAGNAGAGLNLHPASGLDNFIVENSAIQNAAGNFLNLPGNQYAVVMVNPGHNFSIVAWANVAAPGP